MKGKYFQYASSIMTLYFAIDTGKLEERLG